MYAIIRSALPLAIVLIGLAIAAVGVASGVAHSVAAGSSGSAQYLSVPAGGPGSGSGGDGFTWG